MFVRLGWWYEEGSDEEVIDLFEMLISWLGFGSKYIFTLWGFVGYFADNNYSL